MIDFKVGDVVAVCCHRAVTGYEHTNDKIGTIVNIKSYTKCDKTYERIYVDLSPLHNPAQEQGLFIFKKEELMLLKAEEPPIWRCGVTTFSEEELKPYIKIKEEKKEMELLNIYFNEKIKQLEIEQDKKRDKIKTKDPIIKEVYALAKKYKDVKGLSIFPNYEYQFSQEILEEMNKCDREYRVQREKLSSLEYEIKAQLDICETYEQKMNVLKAYGVVDEQGKLNK
jgi:hypothetical protein